MRLEQEKIETALNTARQQAYLPFSLHLYETVNSTNQTLWELLQNGATSGTVVIATEQTAGRGQWGRQWLSQRGGLYISTAITLNFDVINSYQLTFATAWGITRQLQKCDIPVGIKWPNDLILNQRKLGGILTETKISGNKINRAVIGVGINWSNPVPETGINLQSWQKLHQLTGIANLENLATQVLLGIESGIECLLEKGVDILLPRYTNLLTNIGNSVYVENLLGTVIGVTSSGCLHVRMENSESKSVRTPDFYLQPGTISLGYSNSSN
ncbi:biotin--[acetyl-CoA-carboxylase] ligase [Calothrix sp. UHCC 0171]|uniref:biotin--[acetyl-CoA-carboxylase] ligase n=1 Tax=Calothrix sp. UHCC 0171 TaxID=3110245 RepID=UPI002B219B41|nr:biotin--[acetyl-CoA-carboxylase] ligase [Calothrix sp. UHCC 0171]MEA5572668.1 biotin--[acetyl-CoA-carboxylase] ligase [Calothrix sp. UHCC 0171]